MRTNLVLAAFLILSQTQLYAFGGLTGALDEVSNQISGENTNQNTNSNSSQASSSAPTAPTTPVAQTPQTPIVNDGFGPNPADEAKPEVEPEVKKEDGETTVDPKTGIATTVKTFPDGSRMVTKKDKDGNLISEEIFPKGSNKAEVVKKVDPNTGNTITTLHGKDGSKSTIVTSRDGFLVSEDYEEPERPSASIYDPESGVTTTSVKNADGSRTITRKDKDGNVVATETIPPRQKGSMSASVYDPKTGQTTEAVRNPDGSRTITKKDKEGKVLSQETAPPPGSGEAYASAYDPDTGVTTSVRKGADGEKTISESRSWKDDAGTEHTLVTDSRGHQTEIVKNKDGSSTTTQWDANDQKTQTTQRPDGSSTVISPTEDGYLEETTARKDGTTEVVKKTHSGEVLSTTQKTKDGKTIITDEFGTKTEIIPGKEGRVSVVQTDKNGNQVLTRINPDGEIAEQREKLSKPKDLGQRYFENELGGKLGEWDTLPQSAKTQYANSEQQIKNATEMELLKRQQEEEKIRTEEEIARQNEELRLQTEEKLAQMEREYRESQARRAEIAKKQEIYQKRREAKEKMREYERKIYEAQSRGDRKEAERLSIEADLFHDQTVDLFEFTEEEAKAAGHRQAVRDRVTQKVANRARNIAESEMLVTDELQDIKEGVTDKAKWVSIGAEMQDQTKKTTRMADRELAYANAKQAEIARLLADPKTTKEEKEVLYDMLDMADLQASGAQRMLNDNALLTAAGYGLDVATTVTGAKLVAAGKQVVTKAATKVLAKETAEKVVTAVTEKGVVTLAGQGTTKVATATAGKISGEHAALAVEKALTTDVGKVAANAAESAGTRVLGEKGVEAVKNTATKAAELASTNVSDLPSKLKGASGEAVQAAKNTADNAVSPQSKNLADTWADDAADTAIPSKTPKGEPAHANPTSPIEVLEDYAKNPRVRTKAQSGAVDNFPKETIDPQYRRPDFVESRSAWKKKPQAEREAFDQGVRDAVDEAAAMGDKWAKRLQNDLNSGKFKYEYEPGLQYSGLAPGNNRVLVNPLKGGKSQALDSPDKVASTLLHEYVHSYKGPTKYAAEEGLMSSGMAAKGEYNEVRAFMAEANFNKNLRNARELSGKAFDDSTVKELDKLMGVDNLASSGPSMKRGLEARRNLQEGLVDNYNYGKDYANNADLAAERLSTFKGGSMTDIRSRLRSARGPNGEITPEYEKLMQEIGQVGGRTAPLNRPTIAQPPKQPTSPVPPTPPAPKELDPSKLKEAASQMKHQGADSQIPVNRTADEAAEILKPRADSKLQDAERLKGMKSEELPDEVLKKIEPEKRVEVFKKFEDMVPDQDVREHLMRKPGFGDVLDDIAKGGNKEQGAQYQIKKTAEMIEKEGPGSVRSLEDWQPGLPKFEQAGSNMGRLPKQGADTIKTNGDLVQFKSYSDFSSAMREISGFTRKGKIVEEQGQVIRDITRYADRGWVDGTGQPVSGVFEYHIDAAQLRKSANPKQISEMQAMSKKLTEEAKAAFPGKNIEVRIVVN